MIDLKRKIEVVLREFAGFATATEPLPHEGCERSLAQGQRHINSLEIKVVLQKYTQKSAFFEAIRWVFGQKQGDFNVPLALLLALSRPS